ncbi:Sodium/solute symporter superfamily [Sesbania bispinosa]|nr:Sodium/solute symporter superfamily [Sesbania bispinosa]
MCMCGLTVSLCGGKASEGVFVGAFLSMSSTAVVLKFLMEKNTTNALHGQVTIGTLILQDCAVGLLFALLPVLGGTSGVFQGVLSMTKLLVTLIAFLSVLSILSRTCLPWLLKLMISLSSQTNELYQLASVAFCLIVAWCSDKLGLSLELGSFAAGVMIATTDQAQHTLEQVGMSMAQIGEFAFVLLSRASNLHLVEGKLYLLLLGTTALSLAVDMYNAQGYSSCRDTIGVTTPLLFKLIPAVVHLGVLLRWFSPDSSVEIGFKVDNLRSDSGDAQMYDMVSIM